MGYPPPPSGKYIEPHELVHAAEYRAQGMSYKWVKVGGFFSKVRYVVQSSMGNSKNSKIRAMKGLAAGARLGGGDSKKDVKSVIELGKEIGWSEAKTRREMRLKK